MYEGIENNKSLELEYKGGETGVTQELLNHDFTRSMSPELIEISDGMLRDPTYMQRIDTILNTKLPIDSEDLYVATSGNEKPFFETKQDYEDAVFNLTKYTLYHMDSSKLRSYSTQTLQIRFAEIVSNVFAEIYEELTNIEE